MVRVWFLPSAWKRVRASGIWRRVRAALRGDAARGDLARLAEVPAVAALMPEPGAILILCDHLDLGLEAFRARFIQASLCLVTENPDLAATGIPVRHGRIGDRRWLQALAAFEGPNLVIDQRAPDRDAQGKAFVALSRFLAQGGVYALRSETDGLLRWGRARALDRRLTQFGDSPAITDTVQHRSGYRLVAKPTRPPMPIRLLPAAAVPAPPPVAIDAPPYRRATADVVGAPQWIVDSVGWYAGHEVVPREARVYRYADAIVFGFGLVQVGDAIVEESLINRDLALPLGALALGSDGGGTVHHTLPHPRRIAGRTVHVWQVWGENYGHWLIECLPRLHVAARAGLLDGAKVAVHAIPEMEQLYRETLAVLGIGTDRIVWLNQRETIFEELIYPTPVTRQPIDKSPLVIDAALALRDRIGPPAEPLSERIYVSRNRSGRRRLANEAAVIALLDARGYRVVHPETESFARQVQIFAVARFVVGGMGAALSNLAFGPVGLRCLMLSNQDMADDFFLDLVGLKEGAYVSIHGESLSPEFGMHSDYTIALDVLRETLDRHGF